MTKYPTRSNRREGGRRGKEEGKKEGRVYLADGLKVCSPSCMEGVTVGAQGLP